MYLKIQILVQRNMLAILQGQDIAIENLEQLKQWEHPTFAVSRNTQSRIEQINSKK